MAGAGVGVGDPQRADRLAAVLGRAAPKAVSLRVLRPGLAALGAAVLAPTEDPFLFRPLLESLKSETVVEVPPDPPLDPPPVGFDEAVRRAMREIGRAVPG